ncbi:MAG: hypothetical protein CYPHOPRED_005880, partial [Cyphobasidiales sp. Tagirdzhanova-0007]
MTKHSKNRTAAPVFSYAERNETLYGSKKQRLGRDSMRKFDSCSLCLQRAREARMCEEGHLFCQECILTSLLAQKKEIKRQQALLDKMKAEEEQERQLARQQARERVLVDFERLQSGASSSTSTSNSSSSRTQAQAQSSSSNTSGPNTTSSIPMNPLAGTKRKFDFDNIQVAKLADEQEEKALKDIEREQAERRKAKLPNFWLPSLTPEAAPTKISDVGLQSLCHAGTPSHPISLKTLTSVIFHKASDAGAKDSGSNTNGAMTDFDYTCPTCRRTLSNNVASYVLKPCGHVLCNVCVETLVKASSPQQCAYCDTKLLSEKKKPIVALKREGTGFAAGGIAEAKKF